MNHIENEIAKIPKYGEKMTKVIAEHTVNEFNKLPNNVEPLQQVKIITQERYSDPVKQLISLKNFIFNPFDGDNDNKEDIKKNDDEQNIVELTDYMCFVYYF